MKANLLVAGLVSIILISPRLVPAQCNCTVGGLPSVSGPYINCHGAGVLLSATASGATTITWQFETSPGTWTDVGTGSTYTASSAGNYRIKANYPGNCNITSGTHSVTNVYPTGIINASPGGPPICLDAQLTAGAGSDWSWSYPWGGGTGGQYVYATGPGTYTVLYRESTYNCWVNAEATVESCGGGGNQRKASEESDVLLPGKKEVGLKRGLYPNPAKQTVLVALSQPAKQDCPVVFYDLQGRLSKRFAIAMGKKSEIFSISELPAGMYLVTIMDNGELIEKKLIVEK